MTRIPAKIRQQVNERDGNCCRRCGKTATNVHHRIGRGMGGSKRAEVNDLAALVMLCGSGTTGCHGYITTHPDEAYTTGWAIRRSDDDPPESIPLTDLQGRIFWLTEDGGIVPWLETPQLHL